MSPFCILPNVTSSSISQSSYNYLLGYHRLRDSSDMFFNFCNESLMNLRRDGSETPDLKSLNSILASVYSDFSADYRFPGMKHVSPRKMMVNLVPFPRLALLTISRVGLMRGDPQTSDTFVPRLFSNSNLMIPVDLRIGKFLSTQVLFRGAMSHSHVEAQLSSVEKRHAPFFNTVGSYSISSQQIDVPTPGETSSGLMLANHTGITQVIRRYLENFNKMFRRKAYLHWYTTEGMDEMEFTQAESTLNDVISEYEQYGAVTLWQDDEDQEQEGGQDEDM